MDGAQLREFHMPRFVIAVAVVALFAAVLAPTAGATSPSQDQYGSALPGVGGSNGGGSNSSSGSSGSSESTIPVAPSSSSGTDTSGSGTSNASSGSGGNGGASQKSNHAKGTPAGKSNNTGTPAQNANQSVPHIAADSAGDSWVPWFIGGLLALGAAGAVLVYRNRRRAAQS